jgi:hypothetical protein
LKRDGEQTKGRATLLIFQAAPNPGQPSQPHLPPSEEDTPTRAGVDRYPGGGTHPARLSEREHPGLTRRYWHHSTDAKPAHSSMMWSLADERFQENLEAAKAYY